MAWTETFSCDVCGKEKSESADDWWLDELWLAACAEAQVFLSEAPGRKAGDHGNRSTSSGQGRAGTGEKGP